MLHRLLAEFLRHDDLTQAVVIDDMGRMLSSVGEQGALPPTNEAIHLTNAALSAAQHTEFGTLHELWIEGQDTTVIDVLTPYRILMLKGKNGHLARWRHSTDRMRKQLATTPEF
ncbi:MAG: hypothetical protein VW102_03000 [Poseidonia sp.]